MAFSLTDRDSVWSMILSPAVWTLHFLFVYVLSAILCAKGLNEARLGGWGLVTLLVLAATLLAVVLIAFAGTVAWRRWRTRPQPLLSPHDDDTVGSRRRFMAFSSVLLAGLSAVAVLYQTLPVLMIARCV